MIIWTQHPVSKGDIEMARFTFNTRAVAARVRARRKELGLSQEELAIRCGYKSRSSINKIELGGNALTVDTLKRLAEGLNVTVAWLNGSDDDGTADAIRNLLDELTPEQQKTVLAMIKGLIDR